MLKHDLKAVYIIPLDKKVNRNGNVIIKYTLLALAADGRLSVLALDTAKENKSKQVNDFTQFYYTCYSNHFYADSIKQNLKNYGITCHVEMISYCRFIRNGILK